MREINFCKKSYSLFNYTACNINICHHYVSLQQLICNDDLIQFWTCLQGYSRDVRLDNRTRHNYYPFSIWLQQQGS